MNGEGNGKSLCCVGTALLSKCSWASAGSSVGPGMLEMGAGKSPPRQPRSASMGAFLEGGRWNGGGTG